MTGHGAFIIYLNIFPYLQVQEASYGLVRLLSDVGGIQGLWAGISVITLVETTVQVFKLCCRKKALTKTAAK